MKPKTIKLTKGELLLILRSEKFRMQLALIICNQNREKAISMLGMNYRTFYRKQNKYNLTRKCETNYIR